MYHTYVNPIGRYTNLRVNCPATLPQAFSNGLLKQRLPISLWAGYCLRKYLRSSLGKIQKVLEVPYTLRLGKGNIHLLCPQR